MSVTVRILVCPIKMLGVSDRRDGTLRRGAYSVASEKKVCHVSISLPSRFSISPEKNKQKDAHTPENDTETKTNNNTKNKEWETQTKM